MRPNKTSQKAQEILKAIAKGHSCEQILARDRTLTYHDIFRSVSEVPTSHWKKNREGGSAKGWQEVARSAQSHIRHRID